jgi:hypothetical protein
MCKKKNKNSKFYIQFPLNLIFNLQAMIIMSIKLINNKTKLKAIKRALYLFIIVI